MTDWADPMFSATRIFLDVRQNTVSIDVRILSLNLADALKNELFFGQSRLSYSGICNRFTVSLLHPLIVRHPACFVRNRYVKHLSVFEVANKLCS